MCHSMYHVRWWVKRLWWDRSWGFLPAKEQSTETVLYWTINVRVISSQPMGRNYNPVSGTVRNRVLYLHFKPAVTIEGTSLVLNPEGFPGASAVRNSPAVKERRVWSLGQKGPLEAEMATHCSVLAWEIPWREEPGGPVHGIARVGHDWAAKPPPRNPALASGAGLSTTRLELDKNSMASTFETVSR